MFFCVESFNGNISSWNVSNVTDTSGMLEGTPIEDNFKPWFPDFYF